MRYETVLAGFAGYAFGLASMAGFVMYTDKVNPSKITTSSIIENKFHYSKKELTEIVKFIFKREIIEFNKDMERKF